MKKLIKKYIPFIRDIFINLLAFGIYILAQQIILLPILSKKLGDEVYSDIIMFISVLNVIANIFR